MLYHKMTKGESLRMLAQRAGIKLPELPGRGSGGGGSDKDGLTPRERIAATNEWACGWFEKPVADATGEGRFGLFSAGADYVSRDDWEVPARMVDGVDGHRKRRRCVWAFRSART